MPRRPTSPASLLAIALVAALAALAWPVSAFADEDDWRKGRGRRHGRPKVVHVRPAPVVVLPAPVSIVPAPGYVWVPGHYVEQEATRWVAGPPVTVWVPPRFEVRVVHGRLLSLEVAPGHYASRPGPAVEVTEPVRVWVPGGWVPAAGAAYYPGGVR